MKSKKEEDLTPMMKQYYQIKNQYPGTILMFRVGDFFEMFNEDAKIASKELEITLTSKPLGGGVRVPLAGVPYHAINNYIAKFVKKGYRITLCDQVEDPKYAKGIVKRDIIRVITPGTLFTTGVFDPKKNNYLMCVVKNENNYYMSYCDLSEGEILTSEIDNTNAIAEICKIEPAEIIIRESDIELLKFFSNNFKGVALTKYEDYHFFDEECESLLKRHFKVHNLEGFGFYNRSGLKIASAALLAYLYETQKGMIEHIRKIRIVEASKGMFLDDNTIRNLELFNNLHNNEEEYTLVWSIDSCSTSMGSRLLRNFIRHPLTDKHEINFRLNAVSELFENSELSGQLNNVIKGMQDLFRLCGKIGLRICTPRDLLGLAHGLKKIPLLKKLLKDVKSDGLQWIYNEFTEDMKNAADKIEQAIKEDPPSSLKDGGVFKDGYNKELDDLRILIKDGKDWITTLAKKEREKTGINSLKIGFTSVFGYYIEVTKPNLKYVPPEYIRKQTVSNAERFITPELKEKESMILNAEEKIIQIEHRLFDELLKDISSYLESIQNNANAIAHLDVFLNFARLARDRDYSKPVITDENIIIIKNGRHPVIEILKKRSEFIPNETEMGTSEDTFHIITGPNMAGKSTYIRQVALIVLLAQIGSFVPANEAEIGLTDRIFTRIGALDYLAGGLSTFMVEMTETANILNNATLKSLVILDEIGRGTSTYDGVSIAWAVSEFIIEKIRCRTLFATHFHELAELSNKYKNVKNYNISVKEWNNEIIFLHKIVEGCTDRSYGIYVARLAGIPEDALKKAKVILNLLERQRKGIDLNQDKLSQLDIFQLNLDIDNRYQEIIKEIKGFDINNIKPLDALNILCEIQKKIG
ncbi:MAG: DNA mismatch repair protein MutS [Candidatus Hydrogenedentota bacterium]